MTSESLESWESYKRLLLNNMEKMMDELHDIRETLSDHGTSVATIKQAMAESNRREMELHTLIKDHSQVVAALTTALTEVRSGCQFHRKQTVDLDEVLTGENGLVVRMTKMESYWRGLTAIVVLVVTTWGVVIADWIWKLIKKVS